MAVEDVFMHLRSQHEDRIYCSKREPDNKGHKVVVRNNERYVTDIKNRWRVVSARRNSHKDTGFNSVNYLPYKTVGNLNITDVYDLLSDYLGIDINKHQAYVQRYLLFSRFHHYSRSTLKSAEKPNTIEVYDISKKRCRELDPSSTAGLDLIFNKLSSDKRILHDVRAGSSLLEALKRDKHHQDILNAFKAPKISRGGEVTVTLNKACTYLTPKLSSAFSKFCLLPLISMTDPSKTETKKEMLNPDTDTEATRLSQEILRRNFVAKVKSIYSILCCIHNLKVKDLKSYEPMSFTVVKEMCKKLFHTVTLHRPHIGQLHHHLHLERYYHGHIPHFQSSKTIRFSSSSTHLNLWEDLLDIEMECSHSRSSQTARTQRSLPAWKRKVITLEPRDKKKDGEKNCERKLSNTIRAFHFLKSEVADKLGVLLKHNEMIQEKSRALKMKYFRCGPIMKKSLKQMRDSAYHVRWEEGEEDFNLPEWFAILTKEMKNINDMNDVNDVNDVCKVALDGLKQFLYLKTRKTPQVIEKLCFLAMSVPANYLCIHQVILAFQFVCEKILKYSSELIDTLRDIRNIPAVAELHPPDYLFGHLITT